MNGSLWVVPFYQNLNLDNLWNHLITTCLPRFVSDGILDKC